MNREMQAALTTFVNEAKELLTELEQALLEMDGSGSVINSELTNSMFRAVHTIKGSAGLFGLNEIVDISHQYETLLGSIRDGKGELTPDTVEVGLKVCDVLSGLIEQIGKPVSQELTSQCQSLIEMLLELNPESSMLSESSVTSGPITSDADGSGTPADHKTQNENAGLPKDDQCWHISFRPNIGVFKDGLDPKAFIHFLAKLGRVVSINLIEEALINAESFDPELCYLGFEIRLESSASKQKIEDVFEFIRQDAEIHIIAPDSNAQTYIDLINQLPEPNQKLGEMLIRCGAITNSELEAGLNLQSAQKESQLSPPLLGNVLAQGQAVAPEVVQAAVSRQHQKIQSSKTLRVEAEKLDRLIDQVGEMVITGARTTLLAHESGNESLIETITQLERLVENIRDSSLQLRMVQIGETFNKFKRVVRDIALSVDKQVTLQINGAETELDKTFVEKLSDPLTHIIRNAIDHGIELPSERRNLGKPEQGSISLNAYHESGAIVIDIRDDGRGLDKTLLLEQASLKGLISSTSHLNERDIYSLIFEPGFSTSDSVTNLSGRGVGMDVVKRNIEQLRGTVEVTSEPGIGTEVSIRLPLTLSIIDGFMFKAASASYVIPLDNVVECLELHEVVSKEEIEDRHFIDLRGEVLPFLRLRELFGIKEVAEHSQESLVIVQYGSLRAGLIVDGLLGEFQTVIKPLGRLFEGLKGISGATILGNGVVAIILDVFSLIQSAVNRQELESIDIVKGDDEQGA
ncbi:chemotaxis protein CheA [Vibrio makurazakiensis]|uniref:chemotaxis protein CheA n=1 Tax=Vibrio makurazakiensis TaxID=2910250 RepID=UPI003D12EC13